MTSFYRVVLAVCLLIGCLGSEVYAQRPAVCDSTMLLDGRLPGVISVREDLSDWIPRDTDLRILPEQPKPKNRIEVARLLVRSYPPQLRDRGIGDEVVFAVLIDTLGGVMARRLIKSSSYSDFNIAAVGPVRVLRYDPFRIEAGCAVPAVLHMPIVFQIR